MPQISEEHAGEPEHALLTGLNAVQRQAVEHVEGPLLIFAGAGSGKTRVITHRIAYLMKQHGVSAQRILAVTFTNKAANEMAERIATLVEGQAVPWIRTFHATCARWLREHIERLERNYSANFTILDQGESRTLLGECLKELDLPGDEFKPVMIGALIDRAKDYLVGPERFASTYAEALDTHVLEAIHDTYKRYQQKLERSNCLDFADLIRLCVSLLKTCPDVLERYQERYRFILVDEYQDTNTAQYEFTRMLASKYQNLCVVGDDDQAIFSWRGATSANLLNFDHDFTNAKVLTLGQNYRCSGHILHAANGLIHHNNERQDKALEAVRQAGDPIQWYGASTQDQEANYVCREVDRLNHERGVPLNKIAILYRVNTLSRQLEETFIRWRIPYEIVRGLRFYERLEVKDLMAYLKLIVNPHDEASLLRVINRPRRGIGAKTVAAVQAQAGRAQCSLWEALLRVISLPEASSLGAGTLKKLDGFAHLLKGLHQDAPQQSLSRIAKTVIERTGYVEALERSDAAADERVGNLNELVGQLAAFEDKYPDTDLAGFLEETALVSEADHYDGSQQRVAMLTLHAAKGLEFDHVFLVGLEENLLPHGRSIREGTVEEERRLCYVGLTRAKERLYLSWANQRMLYGTTLYNAPSRFLWELPAEDLETALPAPAHQRVY